MKEGTVSPIRLNAMKHHAGYIKSRLEEWKKNQSMDFKESLLALGDNQFDIYTGDLDVTEIKALLCEQLRINRITSRMLLHQWLGRRGYRTVILPDDSRWVIRESESGEDFAHVHPARNQVKVSRIRANHMKTAIAIIIGRDGPVAGESALTTREINKIRVEMFGMSPVRSIQESVKILWTIRFLNGWSNR